ncbi:MAG: DUF4157 domain-containing protein [Deltaproteobacteria bacterium]|nr:DUF4157 domain-containing protein [Deltaproteobacteria bacterium]
MRLHGEGRDAGVTGEDGAATPSHAGARAQTDALTGPGLPTGGATADHGIRLPDGLRGKLEDTAGVDLGEVRVHTGDAAAASAGALGARAATVQQDIHFGAGEYQPETAGGQHLIAHEVAHTVQQRGAEPVAQLRTDGPPASASAEREADGFADAVVFGGAPRTLSAQPVALARQPQGAGADAGRSLESPTHQGVSWVNPGAGRAGTQSMVGVMYFRTKESNLDDQDLARIKELARAYAPYARRNLGKPNAELGLRGRVVGHADPRRSVEPNNTELSVQRAALVARMLIRALAVEAGLIEGNFDIPHSGAGADEPVPSGPEIEMSALATLRRADIFLDAEVLEAAAPAGPAAPEPGPPPPPPPNIGTDYDAWDRFAEYMDRGDRRIIHDVALRMVGTLAGDSTGEILEGTTLASIGSDIVRGRNKDAGTLPFKPVKPPWWDSRGPKPAAPASSGMGRRAPQSPPAPTASQQLIAKQQLLRRDFKETMFFLQTEFSDRNGAYLKWMTEYRKDNPDPEKLREYARTIGYIMFMLDTVQDEAIEVVNLSED